MAEAEAGKGRRTIFEMSRMRRVKPRARTLKSHGKRAELLAESRRVSQGYYRGCVQESRGPSKGNNASRMVASPPRSPEILKASKTHAYEMQLRERL
jgi:hypothetical protein